MREGDRRQTSVCSCLCGGMARGLSCLIILFTLRNERNYDVWRSARDALVSQSCEKKKSLENGIARNAGGGMGWGDLQWRGAVFHGPPTIHRWQPSSWPLLPLPPHPQRIPRSWGRLSLPPLCHGKWQERGLCRQVNKIVSHWVGFVQLGCTLWHLCQPGKTTITQACWLV